MARNLGEVTAASTPAVAIAQRGGRPGWRDPRLWVGVVIVAGSVLLGVRVLAAADDTVQVWAASSDMGAGQPVTRDDLVAERVHFDDAAEQEAYFGVDDTLPAGLQLTRGVGAGELLARSAVGSESASGLLEVPIAVDPEQVPASVRAGAVVDVYVVAASPDAAKATPPGPAIAAATVVDAPDLNTSFGSTGKRQLVLAVPDDDATAFFALLSSYDDPVLTVVRRS